MSTIDEGLAMKMLLQAREIAPGLHAIVVNDDGLYQVVDRFTLEVVLEHHPEKEYRCS